MEMRERTGLSIGLAILAIAATSAYAQGRFDDVEIEAPWATASTCSPGPAATSACRQAPTGCS